MGATEEATYIRKLPCRLTEEELKARLHEAQQKLDESAEADREADRLAGERKAAQARSAAALSRVHELVRIAESGEEEREVLCHHVFDLPSNTVWLKRVDNDGVVEERAMTAEERDEHGQMVLAVGDDEEVPS